MGQYEEPWDIGYQVLHADAEDVAAATKEGRTLTLGDEIGRDPYRLGPIGIDHNHWTGWTLEGPEGAVERAAACVNALENIPNPEAVPGLVEAVREIESGHNSTDPDWFRTVARAALRRAGL